MEDFGQSREEWFRKNLTLKHGIPSYDTFRRVFMAIDSEAFTDCFMK